MGNSSRRTPKNGSSSTRNNARRNDARKSITVDNNVGARTTRNKIVGKRISNIIGGGELDDLERMSINGGDADIIAGEDDNDARSIRSKAVSIKSKR